MHNILKITSILFFYSCLSEANMNNGETKETKLQGVHQTFKNTTTLKLKNIPDCNADNIKSTVFTSKINHTPIKSKNKTIYVKEGVESGVKICLDKNGDLKIDSYKNLLYNKSN